MRVFATLLMVAPLSCMMPLLPAVPELLPIWTAAVLVLLKSIPASTRLTPPAPALRVFMLMPTLVAALAATKASMSVAAPSPATVASGASPAKVPEGVQFVPVSHAPLVAPFQLRVVCAFTASVVAKVISRMPMQMPLSRADRDSSVVMREGLELMNAQSRINLHSHLTICSDKVGTQPEVGRSLYQTLISSGVRTVFFQTTNRLG